MAAAVAALASHGSGSISGHGSDSRGIGGPAVVVAAVRTALASCAGGASSGGGSDGNGINTAVVVSA